MNWSWGHHLNQTVIWVGSDAAQLRSDRLCQHGIRLGTRLGNLHWDRHTADGVVLASLIFLNDAQLWVKTSGFISEHHDDLKIKM